MYELDVLNVGKEKDGDAITARFTRPDTGTMAHIVVDAGWQDDGDKVVAMLQRYEAPSVDVAILTHPDGDHIGGMGKIFDDFHVENLLINRLDLRGGADLPAAKAIKELVEKAEDGGSTILEPRPGLAFANGALTILGPSTDYYDELVQEQLEEAGLAEKAVSLGIREAVRTLTDRVLSYLPVEVPFNDGPGATARNNSSVITLLQVDGERILLTADAGVSAIERALDYAGSVGLDAELPTRVQIPHHGSRRNGSSAMLNRLLGPMKGERQGTAFVSVVSKTDPKHPAGRIVNAFKRRGYPYFWTAGNSLCWHSPDAPKRDDYSPAVEGPVLAELADDA
jgi:beta-lactamase superfamily II metal-dependent hydrolase